MADIIAVSVLWRDGLAAVAAVLELILPQLDRGENGCTEAIGQVGLVTKPLPEDARIRRRVRAAGPFNGGEPDFD